MQSRFEELIKAILDGDQGSILPKSRIEQDLTAAIVKDKSLQVPAKSRIEELLIELYDHMGGGSSEFTSIVMPVDLSVEIADVKLIKPEVYAVTFEEVD